MSEIQFYGIWDLERRGWLGHGRYDVRPPDRDLPRRFAFAFEAEAVRRNLPYRDEWAVFPYTAGGPLAKERKRVAKLAAEIDARLAK